MRGTDGENAQSAEICCIAYRENQMNNEQRHDRIKELTDDLKANPDPRSVELNKLVTSCPHEIKDKEPEIWGNHKYYGSALCWICGHYFGGWYCPDSPDHLCHYSKSYDCCDYCHQPEERK